MKTRTYTKIDDFYQIRFDYDLGIRDSLEILNEALDSKPLSWNKTTKQWTVKRDDPFVELFLEIWFNEFDFIQLKEPTVLRVNLPEAFLERAR